MPVVLVQMGSHLTFTISISIAQNNRNSVLTINTLTRALDPTASLTTARSAVGRRQMRTAVCEYDAPARYRQWYVTEVSEKIWLVSFMNYDLGFFDHESGRVECAENPFGAKVLPMCPE